MRFPSILFDRTENSVEVSELEEPSFFADLNLDQVLESMTAGREEYDLKPFFYAPLHDVAAVQYRHEVLRDLEERAVFESVTAFAQKMRSMREHLAQAEKLHYEYQKERWFLDAVEIYCDAVSSLAEELAHLEVDSRGFRMFRGYLRGYTESDGFASLAVETQALNESLAGVKYSVHIRGNRVRVSEYGGEADYSAEVEEIFAKFKQGAVKDYKVKFSNEPDMDHVEARILDLVAQLHPEVFGVLDEYCARHRDYLDGVINAFDREVQFYLAYLEYIERFKRAGLPFCHPEVCARSKEVHADRAFDLALANKLVPEGSDVVRNDFYLKNPERVLVVTGPNQGGKTTFARMFGQLHYLASLGFPVPAREARLFLPDRLFTHFEREEDLATLRGEAGGRAGQGPRYAATGDERQCPHHERKLHLDDAGGCSRSRYGGAEADNGAGPVVRLRDVRGRAGVARRGHGQHGGYGGSRRSGATNVQGRAKTRRRARLRLGYRREVRPHV